MRSDFRSKRLIYDMNIKNNTEQFMNYDHQELYVLLNGILNFSISKTCNRIQNLISEVTVENYIADTSKKLTYGEHADFLYKQRKSFLGEGHYKYISYYWWIVEQALSDEEDYTKEIILDLTCMNLSYINDIMEHKFESKVPNTDELISHIIELFKQHTRPIKYLQEYVIEATRNSSFMNIRKFRIYANIICGLNYGSLMPLSFLNSQASDNKFYRLSSYDEAVKKDEIYEIRPHHAYEILYACVEWILENTNSRFRKCLNCNRIFVAGHGNDKYCTMNAPQDNSLTCKEYKRRLNSAYERPSTYAYTVKKIQDRKRYAKVTHPDEIKYAEDLKFFNETNKKLKARVKSGQLREDAYTLWLELALASKTTPQFTES